MYPLYLLLHIIFRSLRLSTHLLDSDASEPNDQQLDFDMTEALASYDAHSKKSIIDLPVELRQMIIEDPTLDDEDRFCLKMAIPHYFAVGPSFESLHWSFTTSLQRYRLACRLNRPGSLRCSLCQTRHSYENFAEEERKQPDLVRFCIGWGAIFLTPGVFLPFASLYDITTKACIKILGQGPMDFNAFFQAEMRKGIHTCRDPHKAMQRDHTGFHGVKSIRRQFSVSGHWNEMQVLFEATSSGYIIQRTDIDLAFKWIWELAKQGVSSEPDESTNKSVARYLRGWAMPLCNHYNLGDEFVAGKISEASKTPPSHIDKWTCEACGTKFGLTVDIVDQTARVWLGSRKSLGKIREALDPRWLRHVRNEAWVDKAIGMNWTGGAATASSDHLISLIT